MRLLAVSGVLICLFALPGCIVREIRDEMRSANAQLACVQDQLGAVSKELTDVNAGLGEANDRLDKVDQGLTRLDRTNALIDNVEQGLVRIDRTNASLTDLDKQLEQLRSIESSLSRLDQHLTAVRKTMASLDGMIPFLDLDTGPVTDAPPMLPEPARKTEGEPVAAGTAPGEGNAAAQATPAGEAADPATAGRAARDPLLGIWMSQYPDKGHVLILQSGGRYIRSDLDKNSGHTLQRGTFAREPGGEGAIRFTPEAAAPTPGMSPPMGNNPRGSQGRAGAVSKEEAGVKVGVAPAPVGAPTPAPSYSLQVVSQGARSLALRRDGVVYVYSRP